MKTLTLLLLLLTLGAVKHLLAAEDPAAIKIEICRQKEMLVQLSPNPTYSGTVLVKSVSREPVHFYVFDVVGTMVYHALLLPGTGRSVGALKNGQYSYDVFKNDVSVEQGKISVLEKKTKTRTVR